jgi:hypothetical protein
MTQLVATIDSAPQRMGDAGAGANVAAVARRLQTALADLVAALPGNIERPVALQRFLKVEYSACWNVFNVIRAPDGFHAAKLMPKRPSMGRLIKAAEQVGVSTKVICELRKAADEFDEMVRLYAENRVAFDTMISGMASPTGRPQIDVQERRAAFRANAHIWGSKVDTFVQTGMLRRNLSQPDLIDTCDFLVRKGFERLRPDAPAIAYSSAKERSELRTPLDPEAYTRYGAMLLPEFCTKPLPALKRVDDGADKVAFELAEDALGKLGVMDLAFGSTITMTGTRAQSEGLAGAVSFFTPASRLVFDLIIHRPSLGVVKPEVIVEGMLTDHLHRSTTEGLRALPVHTEVVRLPGGIVGDHAEIEGVPRYVEMLRYGCDVLRWDAAEFDIYRMEMEYPVLHSRVMHRFKFNDAT